MKKNYLFILLSLLMMFVFIPNVKAASTIKWGDTINEEGDLTDSAYYLGNNITCKVNTTDSLYMLGNSVITEGNSEYILAIGSSVSMKGNVVKTAYALGPDVTIESTIGKDLFVAGKTVKIDGPVTGDVYVGGQDVVINSTINGNVYAAAKTIKLTSSAVVTGKILYNNNVKIEKDDKAQTGSADTYYVNTNAYSLLNSFNSTMFAYLNMLVIGLILLYYFPAIFKKIDNATKDNSVKAVVMNMLDGLLALIVIPIVAAILMIFQFGIATGVLGLILSGLVMYLSSLVTAWVISNYINKLKIFKVENKYLTYALALFLIYILRLVPVVGVIVVVLAVLYGYGLFIHIAFKKS